MRARLIVLLLGAALRAAAESLDFDVKDADFDGLKISPRKGHGFLVTSSKTEGVAAGDQLVAVNGYTLSQLTLCP